MIRFLGIAVAVIALAPVTFSSVGVRTSPVLLTEGMRVQFVPAGDVGRTTLYHRGSDLTYREVGQSFTVSGVSFAMRALSFHIDGFHTNIPGQNFRLKIYELSSPTTAPAAPAVPISTQEGTLPSALESDSYLTLILDTPVALESGHHYLFMFSFAGPTSTGIATETLGLERTNGSSGSSGRMWLCTNGVFASDTKAITFVIHDNVPSPQFMFGASASLYKVSLGSAAGVDPEAQSSLDRLIGVLGNITGQPIIQDNGSSTGILLGVAADYPSLASAFGLNAFSATGREDYLIYSENDKLYLVGATPLGLRHAVSDLLYQWGFRQYFPSARWRIVPSAATLTLKATHVERPDFFVRDLFTVSHYDDAQRDAYAEWLTLNRMGIGFRLNTKHAYNLIYTRNETVFYENPSYFAKVDGEWQTTAVNKKFNPANPALVSLITADANVWLAANSDQDSISMEPSDGAGWDNSGDAFTTIGSPTNQALALANQVASTVAAPQGKYVGMYAYGQHQYVPTVTVEPNVIVSFATHLVKANIQQQIDGWIDQGTQLIGIRDYASVFSWNRNLPGGSEGIGLEYAKHYIPIYSNGMGARFYTSEFENAWAVYGPAAYYLSRILWDTTTDPDTVMSDFSQKCFGSAAPKMTQFYHLIAGSGSTYVRRLPTGELYALLNDALAAEPSSVAIRERIAGLVGYVRYMELLNATQTTMSVDRDAAIEDLYRWVLRMQPWDMMPTRRLVRHSLGFSSILPPARTPTTAVIDTWEASAKSDPVTLTELVSLVASRITAGPATRTFTTTIPRMQSTTSPWIRQGGSFVFPLGAAQSVSLTLSHRRINVSPNSPNYTLLHPDGTVMQHGRLKAEASDVITFTSTTAGNYVVMTDGGLSGVCCASATGFLMEPQGGRISMYKFTGTVHIVVPAGENVQLSVEGAGDAEFTDVEIRNSANVLIGSAVDVSGFAPYVINLPVAAAKITYQIKLIAPVSGKPKEDVYLEFRGGYASPVALNPNFFQ